MCLGRVAQPQAWGEGKEYFCQRESSPSSCCSTTSIVIVDNDNGSYSSVLAYNVPGSVLNAFLGCFVLIHNSESGLFLYIPGCR